MPYLNKWLSINVHVRQLTLACVQFCGVRALLVATCDRQALLGLQGHGLQRGLQCAAAGPLHQLPPATVLRQEAQILVRKP